MNIINVKLFCGKMKNGKRHFKQYEIEGREKCHYQI